MTKKQKVEQIAIDTFIEHTSKFERLNQKWVALMKRYENEERKGSISSETQSNVQLGQAFALVENFTSRVISQVPRFHYLPRERKDVEFVEQYDEFNEYQHDQADSKDEYEMIAKWGGICGLSGFKMGWKIEETIIKKKGTEVMGKVITNPALMDMMKTLKIGRATKVDDKKTISNWTIDAIPPHDLIWDVKSLKRKDCFVLGHKIHNKTIKELRREGYDMKKMNSRIKDDKDYWKEQLDKYKGQPENRILENITVELAELGIKYLNEDGMYEYWVVTLMDIAGRESNPSAIRTEKNKYDRQFNPVGMFRPMRRPGKIYGTGIIEEVLGVLDLEEDTLNMVVEAFWTDVARPMEYNPQNIIDEDALEYKPRTLVPVRRLGESVKVMEAPSPNMNSASFILGYAEKTKQNVSAITDYQTGADQGPGNKTATEINTKAFLSEQRTSKILQRFESEVLELSGKMALWLNQQYLADEKKIIYRVLGKKGKMMEKEMKFKDVEAIKDVIIIGGSSAYVNRTEERQKWAGLLQMSSQEVAMGPVGVPIDREYIWKRLLEDGFAIKDPENVIPSLKEREEANVQKKMGDVKKAKEENANPMNARVMPDDDHKVHLQLHQAAVQAGGDGQKSYTPEEVQMLTEHINKHVELAGGANPNFAQATEQAIGQGINNGINPNEQRNTNNPQPRQDGGGGGTPRGAVQSSVRR